MIAKTFSLASLLLTGTLTVAENGPIELKPLSSEEIQVVLAGKFALYSPSEWGDAGMLEEFRDKGRWSGVHFGRGLSSFSGQWKIKDDQLCIRVEQGLEIARLREWFCRAVWRQDGSARLYMDHLIFNEGNIDPGPLQISVRPLSERYGTTE